MMSFKEAILLIICAGAMCSVSFGQVTFVDAVAANSVAPVGWNERSVFGNGGSTWQNASATDDSPMVTTISGLQEGEFYKIYIYYWSQVGLPWRVTTSFENTPKRIFLSNQQGFKNVSLAPLDSDGDGWEDSSRFNTPLMVTEENRFLLEAFVGTVQANSDGSISVQVDDDTAVDSSSRVFWCGLGYELTADPHTTVIVDDFKVDFSPVQENGQSGTYNQPGFFPYVAVHEANPLNGSDPDLSVDREVAFTVSNLGQAEVSLDVAYPSTSAATVKQMMGRSEAELANYTGDFPDLMRDWIGIDSRRASGGNGGLPTTIRFQIGGLPAGTYIYRGYHHDVARSHSAFDLTVRDARRSEELVGTFEMTYNGIADDGWYPPSNPIDMPGGSNDPAALRSTIELLIESDGATPVELIYSISESNLYQSFLGINGIEVIPVIDSDGDYVPDESDSNPGVNDRFIDSDGDSLNNLAEYHLGTDPALADTDSDGLPDGLEVRSSPFISDSDGDGLIDGYEVNMGSNPASAGSIPEDIDADGMGDAWERLHGLYVGGDDSADDRDQDGLTNLEEFLGVDGLVAGIGGGLEDSSNPESSDTDGDTYSDLVELLLGTRLNDHSSIPHALICQSDFALMPWIDVGSETQAITKSEAPLLPGSGSYGVIDTSAANSGVALRFVNPNVPIDCLLDFRIDGVLDEEINVVVSAPLRVRTGSDTYCALRVRPDGSLAYYDGSDLVTSSPAGTVVAGHTYSLRFRYDIPSENYQIALLDRSAGGVPVIGASGTGDFETRNTSIAGELYFGIGMQRGGQGGFELAVDNIAVFRGQADTGTSLEVIDTDEDGVSDIWEWENLLGLNVLGREDDSDGDVMDQAWEITNFGDENQEALGNPDGDLATNWEEYLAGTDPNLIDSNPGYWSLERWLGMPYYDVPELVSDKEFYRPADTLTALRSSGATLDASFAGSRLRGYIEVEEAGDYFFWISCRTSANLLLSRDNTPFHKRVIASMGADIGTGQGIRFDSGNLWDLFSSQVSEPVTLQAGQKYYLEVNHQNGHGRSAHLHVAWAPASGVRTLIPRSAMSSFPGHPDDLDDDCIPDSWETQFGLNPNDNGFIEFGRQGERGDYDEDGLRNREEYLLGTDPTNPDTDGDGLSDYAEHLQHNTDPLVSNTSADFLASSISPASVLGIDDSESRWVETTEGVLTTSFRGEGIWNFDVPEDGFWVLQVEGRLHGDPHIEDVIPVMVDIDGKTLPREVMRFNQGQFGSIRPLSPYLTAGSHTLRLFFDNYTARITVEITAIRVIRPGGFDADGDGISDSVEATLAERSQIFDRPLYSHYSPAFVEGRASNLELVDLTLITRSSEVDRARRFNNFRWQKMLPRFKRRLKRYAKRLQSSMRAGQGRMEGVSIPHEYGAGSSNWYSYIDLARNGAIGYVAQFEDLGTYETQAVIWTPYNVIDGGSINVPLGSDLLLGAWVKNGDRRNVTLLIDGISYRFRAALSHVHHCGSEGTFTVVGSHPNGDTGTLIVNVIDAALPETMAIAETVIASKHLPDLASDLSFDGGEHIRIWPLESHSSVGSQLKLASRTPGNHRIAARLSSTGPVLDREEMSVVGISDALRMRSDTVGLPADGLFPVSSPMLITHLPPGATVEVSIFAGGVTFADGTTVKTLSAGDFDQSGVYTLQFLIPEELLRAPCHYIRIYDANGELIGSEEVKR